MQSALLHTIAKSGKHLSLATYSNCCSRRPTSGVQIALTDALIGVINRPTHRPRSQISSHLSSTKPEIHGSDHMTAPRVGCASRRCSGHAPKSLPVLSTYSEYDSVQNKSSAKVIWEEPRRHPSWQRMDSSAAYASCAVATADEFSQPPVRYIHATQTHDDGIPPR